MVGLHVREVVLGHGVENVHAIEGELGVREGEEGAGIAGPPKECLNGMIEVGKVDLGVGVLLDALNLGDEHLHGLAGQLGALIGIELDVVRVELGGRGNPRVELDANLHVVILEGDQGEGKGVVVAEGEVDGKNGAGVKAGRVPPGGGLGPGVGQKLAV